MCHVDVVFPKANESCLFATKHWEKKDDISSKAKPSIVPVSCSHAWIHYSFGTLSAIKCIETNTDIIATQELMNIQFIIHVRVHI